MRRSPCPVRLPLLCCLLAAACGEAPVEETAQGASTANPGVTPDWPAGREDDIRGVPRARAKYKNCSALWTCGVTACQANGDADCLRPCLEAASTTLVSAFENVTKCAIHICANKRCAGSTAAGCVSECMWSRCLGFGVACSAPAGVVGDGDCGEALACVKGCGGQMPCLGDCYSAMGAPEQGAFLTLWSCIATSEAADPFVDCYDMALACGGSSDEPGTKSCYDVLQCSGECGAELTSEEFNCNTACFSEGSLSGREQFAKVVNCYTGFAGGKGPGDCTWSPENGRS